MLLCPTNNEGGSCQITIIVQDHGCVSAHLTPHLCSYCSFQLPLGSFTDGQHILAPERAALILFNMDSACVEGLWSAVQVVDGMVQWASVAVYEAVPQSVWGGLLQLAPWKGKYTGDDAVKLLTAMYEHARPPAATVPVPTTPDAAAIVAPRPGSASSATSSSSTLVGVAPRDPTTPGKTMRTSQGVFG